MASVGNMHGGMGFVSCPLEVVTIWCCDGSKSFLKSIVVIMLLLWWVVDVNVLFC